MSTARELGVTIVAYTPVARGLLTGKYRKNPGLLNRISGLRKASLLGNIERTRPIINVMDEIASNHKAKTPQVALKWLIQYNGDLVLTIPGATNVGQVKESAGAMKFQLSKDELSRLDEVSNQIQNWNIPQDEGTIIP